MQTRWNVFVLFEQRFPIAENKQGRQTLETMSEKAILSCVTWQNTPRFVEYFSSLGQGFLRPPFWTRRKPWGRGCWYPRRALSKTHSLPKQSVLETKRGWNNGVSVQPGTAPEHPGTPPEHPGTSPEHPRNSPEQPRNTPGACQNTPEHPIMPRNTLNTARNTLEHQK